MKQLDPVVVHSRNEAILITCVWLVAMVWAVPFCYFNGYIDDFDPQNLQTVWGIPSWLFYGIVVPWIAADIFTIWFCFCYMKDDDLGSEQEESDIEKEFSGTDAPDAAQEESQA